jgi:hypothetical protein
MESQAVRLVDHVLRGVAMRLWTLSLPFDLRRLLASDAGLLTAAHRLFIRGVFRFLCEAATKHGLDDPRPGAVSFIQRFSSTSSLPSPKTASSRRFSITSDCRASCHRSPQRALEIPPNHGPSSPTSDFLASGSGTPPPRPPGVAFPRARITSVRAFRPPGPFDPPTSAPRPLHPPPSPTIPGPPPKIRSRPRSHLGGAIRLGALSDLSSGRMLGPLLVDVDGVNHPCGRW